VYTYRPDLVVVDGIYLMQGAAGDSHWEKITSISRSLKQLAEGEGTPVLGLHQANRQAIGKRIEIEHIAYADALAQDADLVMAINAEDDGSHFVEAIKNRWGDKAGWGMFMNFFFDSMTVRVRDAKHAPKGGSL
jgi:replicative DNA helicase